MTTDNYKSPLAGFADLGNSISIWESDVSDISADCSDPEIIVLCTWLGGASASRIAKYTNRYRELHPTSPILLIRTVFNDLAFRSFAVLRQRLAPAIRVLNRFAANGIDLGNFRYTGILLHIFSNGGGNMATQLAMALRTSISWRTPASPFRLVIFDCCPGLTTFRKQYSAAVHSLPPTQPINAIGRAILLPFVGGVSILQDLRLYSGGRELQRDLNDAKILGSNPHRLYLYSTVDPMFDYLGIEAHRDNGHQKGYKVDSEKFDNATHCALMLSDETRYWGAIQRSWEKALLTNEITNGIERSRL